MIHKCAVVFTVLELVLGSPHWYQEDEKAEPSEPEYEHTVGVHKADFEHAYLRYKADLDETGGKPRPGGILPYLFEKNKFSSLHDDEAEHDDPEIHEEDPRFLPFEPDSFDDVNHNTEEYDEPRTYEHDEYEYVQYRTPRSNRDTYGSPFKRNTQNNGGTRKYDGISSPLHQDVSRYRRSVELYEGPPAPLNEDLTVDFTPEIKQLTEAHQAATEKEYKRLQATAALAAAYPDRTSPPSKDYRTKNNDFSVQIEGLQFARKKRSYTEQYSPQQQNARHYDDGQYKHHFHKHDDGQYKPHLHRHDEGQYKPHLHQVVDYNTVPFQPAPLNADGTVAHVPEFHAIAASHLTALHQALSSTSG